MSKIYQLFLSCGFVVTAANVFAETNYAELQKQVIASDAVLNSLQQSEQAYEIHQKFAGRLNNPTFNVELDSLGNSKLKDLDGPTTLLGLSQEIPLSNKLSLRKQIASFQGDRNQFEIANDRLNSKQISESVWRIGMWQLNVQKFTHQKVN